MHSKILRKLTSLKDDLNRLIEENQTIIDHTTSIPLQNEVQKNVLDYLSETIDEIDVLIENINNGDYDEPDDFSFDDY